MVVGLDWKDFVKTKPPMEDEETGDSINDHELFCLWVLYQGHMQTEGYEDVEQNTAEKIQAFSCEVQDAPLFEDVNYVEYCLLSLVEKGLIKRTTPVYKQEIH